MITWIQIVLQKHHKSVFGVLLVAIIIAFVFTIGSVPFFGDRYNVGSQKGKVFYGFDLSNEAVVSQLQNCVYFEIILSGQQPQSEAQFTQLVLRQAYLRSVAEQLGMKQVSQADLDEYIQASPIFADNSGKFSPETFKKFVDARIASGRMSEETLSQILAQNALVNKVAQLLGGPGYMPKFEIERQYAQMYGTWDFNIARLPMDGFKPEIKPSAATLEKYFKDNVEAYRIGNGVVVETVFFPAKDFSKESVPNETELSAYYGANMRKYATTKDGQPYMPKLSEIRENVKADYIIENAVRKAAHKAEEFVLKIYDSELKKGSAEIKKIADEFKVAFKKQSPIRVTDQKLPAGIPTEVAVTAMKLDSVKFYSDPIPSGDGGWVVFLVDQLPSYLPKYDEVKDRVLENYVASEKARMFAEHANTLDKALVKAVADKKSFASVARAAGAIVDSVKSFSLIDPKGDSVLKAYSVISSTLPSLSVGQVSQVKTQGENAYIIELLKFTPPADKADAAKLASLKSRMENGYASISSMTVIMEKIKAAEKNLEDK